jgi:GT2 family glycosyltransferase
MPRSMSIELIVLNYNGRALLAECLASVVAAAARSSRACHVTVIDNGSTDDSIAYLRDHFPAVRLLSCANRGLCSYNEVVAESTADVAVLLNNDVRLDPSSIDPLAAPLIDDNACFDADCFLTAPRCYRFDGVTHEGEKTAVRWRWGLIEGTAFFPGYSAVAPIADWTAAAGCVMAVSRQRFMRLGGFDPLYLPGRLEDLDLGYRGFAAGWHASYVPSAVAYHRGAASFEPAFGAAGCDALALRNTLLFQWKNLRHPAHRARMIAGLGTRLAADVIRAPWTPSAQRWAFARACKQAHRAWQQRSESPRREPSREREFFARFHPRRLAAAVQEAAA